MTASQPVSELGELSRRPGLDESQVNVMKGDRIPLLGTGPEMGVQRPSSSPPFHVPCESVRESGGAGQLVSKDCLMLV